MKLVTYRLGQNEARMGVISGRLIIDVEKFGKKVNLELTSSMLDFIELGPIAVESLDAALKDSNSRDYVGISVPYETQKYLHQFHVPKKIYSVLVSIIKII